MSFTVVLVLSLFVCSFITGVYECSHPGGVIYDMALEGRVMLYICEGCSCL